METALEEITEAELLEMALDARQQNIHVAIPARVDAFNKGGGQNPPTVKVTPQLNRQLPDGDGNFVSQPLPQLDDVPVVYPRCGQFLVAFPVVAGDFGLLVICQRNLAAWRATGQQGDPGDLGMHTLDGAVFLPGLYPDASPPASIDGTNMVVGSDTDGDSRIELKPTGGGNLGAGASKGIARKGDATAGHHHTITAAQMGALQNSLQQPVMPGATAQPGQSPGQSSSPITSFGTQGSNQH